MDQLRSPRITQLLGGLFFSFLLLLSPTNVEGSAAQVDRVGIVGSPGSYSGNALVPSWRGKSVQYDIFMASSLVTTASGVEVRTGSGMIPGFSATIASRSLGPTSYLRINLTPGQLPTPGDYRVRVLYPVQSGAPTEFPLRLLEIGKVDQVSVPKNRLREGESYTFTATGQRLGNATFLPSDDLDQIQVLSRSPNQVQIRARVTLGGAILRIDGSAFYDENTPSPSQARRYESLRGLTIPVEPNPVVSTVSTTTAEVGQTVSVTGSGLRREGWETLISYGLRTCPSSGSGGLVNCMATVTPIGANANGVAFTVNADMKPSTLRVLLKADPSTQRVGFDFVDTPFPQTLMVTGLGPVTISSVTPLLATSTTEMWVAPGILTLMGRHLVPDSPNEPLVVTVGSQKLPIVRRNVADGQLEVDASGVRTPAHTDLVVRRGTSWVATQRLNFVVAPSVRGITKPDGTAPSTLQPYSPGRTYVLVGNNLCVPSAAGGIDPSVKIEIGPGQAIPATAQSGSTNPANGIVASFRGEPVCSSLSFTIPTTVPHGRHPIRFSHRGGSVSAGSYTVGPPLATVQLRPLQLSRTRGGTSVTMTLAQVAVTDLEVRLTGTSPLAVPRSVRFKAGEQRKVFTVGLRPRARPGKGTVTATVGTGGRGQVQHIQVTLRQ